MNSHCITYGLISKRSEKHEKYFPFFVWKDNAKYLAEQFKTITSKNKWQLFDSQTGQNQSLLYFTLFNAPDNFTRQGRAAGWERVNIIPYYYKSCIYSLFLNIFHEIVVFIFLLYSFKYVCQLQLSRNYIS